MTVNVQLAICWFYPKENMKIGHQRATHSIYTERGKHKLNIYSVFLLNHLKENKIYSCIYNNAIGTQKSGQNQYSLLQRCCFHWSEDFQKLNIFFSLIGILLFKESVHPQEIISLYLGCEQQIRWGVPYSMSCRQGCREKIRTEVEILHVPPPLKLYI